MMKNPYRIERPTKLPPLILKFNKPVKLEETAPCYAFKKLQSNHSNHFKTNAAQLNINDDLKASSSSKSSVFVRSE